MGKELQHIVRGTLMFILSLVIFYFGKLLLNINYPAVPVQNATIVDSYSEPAREFSVEAIRGKTIFKENCAACHRLSGEYPSSLVGVESRWPNKNLLILWIKDWRKAVATNDPYAIQVSQISKSVMTVFEKLTDDEIESILQYLTEEETRRER